MTTAAVLLPSIEAQRAALAAQDEALRLLAEGLDRGLIRAMSTALVLAADGRRENGRWRRGSLGIGESPDSGESTSVELAAEMLGVDE
jgi:hypothetical protein